MRSCSFTVDQSRPCVRALFVKTQDRRTDDRPPRALDLAKAPAALLLGGLRQQRRLAIRSWSIANLPVISERTLVDTGHWGWSITSNTSDGELSGGEWEPASRFARRRGWLKDSRRVQPSRSSHWQSTAPSPLAHAVRLTGSSSLGPRVGGRSILGAGHEPR